MSAAASAGSWPPSCSTAARSSSAPSADRDSVADLLQKYPEAFHRELLDVTDADAVRDVTDRSFASLGRIVGVLKDRIASFEAQADLAASTDFPPGE